MFVAFANVIRTQYLIPYKYDEVYIQSVGLGALANLTINFCLIPTYKGVRCCNWYYCCRVYSLCMANI